MTTTSTTTKGAARRCPGGGGSFFGLDAQLWLFALLSSCVAVSVHAECKCQCMVQYGFNVPECAPSPPPAAVTATWTSTACPGNTRFTIQITGNSATVTNVQFKYNTVNSCAGASDFGGATISVTSSGGTSSDWTCGNPTYYVCAEVTYSDGSTQQFTTPAK